MMKMTLPVRSGMLTGSSLTMLTLLWAYRRKISMMTYMRKDESKDEMAE